MTDEILALVLAAKRKLEAEDERGGYRTTEAAKLILEAASKGEPINPLVTELALAGGAALCIEHGEDPQTGYDLWKKSQAAA